MEPHLMMRAEGERCLHPELWTSRWHLKGMLSSCPGALFQWPFNRTMSCSF